MRILLRGSKLCCAQSTFFNVPSANNIYVNKITMSKFPAAIEIIRRCIKCKGTHDNTVVPVLYCKQKITYACKRCDLNSIRRCASCAFWTFRSLDVNHNCPCGTANIIRAEDVSVCTTCNKQWIDNLEWNSKLDYTCSSCRAITSGSSCLNAPRHVS